MVADDAANKLSSIEEFSYSEETTHKQWKNKAQTIVKLKNDALNMFEQAARTFIEIGNKRQAAQCLFSSERYQQAAELFEEIGYTIQSAESNFKAGNYEKAAK